MHLRKRVILAVKTGISRLDICIRKVVIANHADKDVKMISHDAKAQYFSEVEKKLIFFSRYYSPSEMNCAINCFFSPACVKAGIEIRPESVLIVVLHVHVMKTQGTPNKGNHSMQHQHSKELDEIVSIIKKTSSAKIFLFGSHASGGFDSGSDIDLLIVTPSTEPPVQRRIKLRKMLKEYDRLYGLDLVVYTPEEFAILRNEPSSFVFSSLKRGIKLYDVDSC
jgi:uncharacterized protein